jgi:large subunit ribosomal protein L30
MSKTKTGQIKIRQIRSVIDRPKNQKLTIEALGLGRPNWEKIHNDTPQIRGMINKVIHLVEVEGVEQAKTTIRKKKEKTETKEE